MRSPAYGLARHLWLRHRLGMLMILLYLLAEAVAVLTIPKTIWSTESVGASVAIPLTLIGVYLIAIFINPDADFATTVSGYPAYLFTLPVRTRDLAVWPMLYGAGSVALVWLAAAGLILIPRGIPAPLWWPAAMLASTLACLQAIIWYPIPLPYLRALLAVILLPASTVAGVAGFQSGVSEGVLTAAYLSVIPVAYLFCLSGLNRARQGYNDEWSWIPERTKAVSERTPWMEKPFASPGHAQLWMEWKRNGVMLPILVGAACALLSTSLLFIHESAPLKFVPPGAGPIEANTCISILLSCMGLPIWFGMVMGSGGRKTDTRRKDLSIHPFIATRPMTSISLVAAKLKMAALSSIAACAVVLVFLGLWLLLPAKEGNLSAPLGYLLVRHLTLKQSSIVILALVTLVALTWKSQIDNLYVDLVGRRWLVQGFPIVFSIGVTIAIMIAIPLVSNPEQLPRVLRLLPSIAFAFAAIKLLARGYSLRLLVRSRLVTSRAAAMIVVGWGLIAVLLFALLYSLTPPGFIPAKYLALVVFLSLPFARLGAAPLALEWNRHR